MIKLALLFAMISPLYINTANAQTHTETQTCHKQEKENHSQNTIQNSNLRVDREAISKALNLNP